MMTYKGPMWVLHGLKFLYGTHMGPIWASCPDFAHMGPICPCVLGSDLKRNSHIRNVCSRANATLGSLRRNIFSCPRDVKEAAYKTLVRPILEYGSIIGILIVMV